MPDIILRNSGHLPQLIQSLRKESGLSQTEISRRLGIAQQTYSALERRADKTSAERLLELFNVLGVELVLRRTTATQAAAPASTPSTGPVW